MIIIFIVISIIIIICLLSLLSKNTIYSQIESSIDSRPMLGRMYRPAVETKNNLIGDVKMCKNDILNLSGKILIILNFPPEGDEGFTLDTFVALLDKDGCLTSDKNLLFYNSELRSGWIFQYDCSESKVPHSTDGAVYGPLAGDDVSDSRYCEYCFIDLDKVSSEICRIQIFMNLYEALNDDRFRVGLSGFQILILKISPEEIENLNSQELEKKLDRVFVSDVIRERIAYSSCFEPFSLNRDSNGTWSYHPIWQVCDLASTIDGISKKLPT